MSIHRRSIFILINLHFCYHLLDQSLMLFSFLAWLGSVGISITLFLSPIISTICQRKSARIYAVIGGLICALGCLFLAFSNQMEQVFISHCVVLSPGSGITLNTANIIIGRYFRKKRELAEMIMLSGTGLGAALLAVLFRELYWYVQKNKTKYSNILLARLHFLKRLIISIALTVYMWLSSEISTNVFGRQVSQSSLHKKNQSVNSKLEPHFEILVHK